MRVSMSKEKVSWVRYYKVVLVVVVVVAIAGIRPTRHDPLHHGDLRVFSEGRACGGRPKKEEALTHPSDAPNLSRVPPV